MNRATPHRRASARTSALLGSLLWGFIPAARGQTFTMDWYTIDGGSGNCSGGPLALSGTLGQPDAGLMSGGPFTLGGGFWYAVTGTACYANCDASTTAPALNVLDFACFLSRFAAGDAYANCDNSTTAPILNVQDFSCFLNRFAEGCS